MVLDSLMLQSSKIARYGFSRRLYVILACCGNGLGHEVHAVRVLVCNLVSTDLSKAAYRSMRCLSYPSYDRAHI